MRWLCRQRNIPGGHWRSSKSYGDCRLLGQLHDPHMAIPRLLLTARAVQVKSHGYLTVIPQQLQNVRTMAIQPLSDKPFCSRSVHIVAISSRFTHLGGRSTVTHPTSSTRTPHRLHIISIWSLRSWHGNCTNVARVPYSIPYTALPRSSMLVHNVKTYVITRSDLRCLVYIIIDSCISRRHRKY